MKCGDESSQYSHPCSSNPMVLCLFVHSPFCLFQVAGPIGRAPAKEKRGGAAKGRSGSGFGGKLRADGADIFGKVGKGKCARGNEKKGKWKSKASGGISRPPPSTMGYDNPPPEG